MTEDMLARIDRLRRQAATETSVVSEVVPSEVTPLRRPESGFVDLTFDEGRLLSITDARGLRTEIGHWLEQDGRMVLRIPWPVLIDPTSSGAGRSRGRQVTEVTAAAMQLPRSGTARAKVLSAFILDWRNGGEGLIDEDVAAKLSMNLYTAAPRRTELVNMGWLRASGRFGRTKMDSESIKWELSPAAVDKLKLSSSKGM